MINWFCHMYPYGNLHELNLDWVIATVKHGEKEIADFIGVNTIKYANPILWNIESQYEANTVVVDGQTGNAYISVKPVPSGVHLNRTEYWTQIYNYANVVDTLREQIAYNEGESTTATRNYVKGDLLFSNGLLYRVIAENGIIPGDSFVEHSNVEKTTIENELSRVVEELQPTIDEIIDTIGELSDLDTEAKNNVVSAINEVLSTLSTTIGELSGLDTEAKNNVVSAINEVVQSIIDIDYMPAIDVTKHGLVADGVTDNYSAFNTLYATHKNLYFPDGEYYFSQPININQRGSIIAGNGAYTRLLFDTDGILISNFYCELHDFSMRTRGQNVYGIKLLSSYAKIHDIYMYDSATTWFNNFVLGTVGQGVWFSFIENIIINDSNNHSNNGNAFEFTSTVNNVLTNVIVTQKNKGLVFNNDRTTGYSTDGCQLNDFNVTQTNYAIQINDCSAIYVSHSIFDQINIKCLELIDAKNITFDECYLSAGSNSVATYKIADIITSDTIRINNTQMAGTGGSSYGIVVQGTKELTITDCHIGYTINGITFSDSTSSNCYLHNIYFNDLVQHKLYIQGYTNIYGLLKGIGDIIVAGGLQSATAFNQGTITISDLGTNYYYDCDIPLPTGMAKPIGVFVIPFNADANVVVSYLNNNSPSGYVRIRIRKVDGTVFNNENLTLSYIYPIA